MKTLLALIKRDMKLFFKDKTMFVTSLITPIILLVLYTTFLAKVYKDIFISAVPEQLELPEKLINGLVGGQLVSSILAVSCVSVAFCSNMLMIQDKSTQARGDLTITPVRRSALALAYYISSAAATMIICFTAVLFGFIYLGFAGWYLSAADVVFLFLDVLLLLLFGTALSSVIHYFLSTSGQGSAVGTIVSAGYGFICGAYMPISQFGGTLQKILSFFPGSYGTALIRNHCMRGAFAELESMGLPAVAIDGIKDSLDCNLYFFGDRVDVKYMLVIVLAAAFALSGIYVLMNIFSRKKQEG